MKRNGEQDEGFPNWIKRRVQFLLAEIRRLEASLLGQGKVGFHYSNRLFCK